MPSRVSSMRGPVTAVILLSALVVALRGWLPDATGAAGSTPAERESGGPASLILVGMLAATALGVLAMAVIHRLRHRSITTVRPAGRAVWRRDGGSRPSWRVVLLGLSLVIAYLLTVTLVARLWAPSDPVRTEPDETGAESGPGIGPEVDPAVPGSSWADPPSAAADAMPHLLAATIAFVLMVIVGSLAARRRGLTASAPTAAAASAAPAERRSGSLARAAEVGLAEIGEPGREPRDAIIACYAAMERELARVPDAAPQQFDTASEVLARAVEHHALPPGSATRLVELFGEARFSRHLMREEHRDAAVDALRVVLGHLRGQT